MLLIADFHNKSGGRLRTSHFSGEKDNCCMTILTDINSKTLVQGSNLCKPESTLMDGLALIFSYRLSQYFLHFR